jgi:protein arginine N-methyltransferase 1
MRALELTTEIVRVPELWMDLDTSNELRVHTPEGTFRLGPHALSLLDAVHTPTTVGEALRQATRGRTGAASSEVTRALLRLMASGIVRSSAEVGGFTRSPFPKGGYDSAYVHLRMLEDRRRKLAFTRAVEAAVRPGDVVVDLGTGSGILAVAAARAGAAKVWALEPSNMRTLAAKVFADNGCADVIEVVPGWSADFELDVPADVLTTDIVGNEPLDMRLWETVHDARQRLLRPGARTVPTAIEARAVLARVPDDEVARHVVTRQHLSAWREEYGIDFSALVDDESTAPLRGCYERPEVVRRWTSGSADEVVYRLQLADRPRTFRCDVDVSCDLPEANAVVIWFRADLGPGHEFVAHPRHGSVDSHWFCAVWLRQRPWHSGETARLRYSYLGDGHSVVTEREGA